MSVDEVVTQEPLRGKPFIASRTNYPMTDRAHGSDIDRTCDYCAMRYSYATGEAGKKYDTCMQPTGEARVFFFDIKPDEKLPSVLDGKNVGNYCPYFSDMDAD